MALKDEKFFSSLHSCAIAIQRSMMRALWAGLVCWQRGAPRLEEGEDRKAAEDRGDEFGEEEDEPDEEEDEPDEEEGGLDEGHRREVMTQLVTELNCEMVARTVGARFLFSFLSRWDQTQPKQWKGVTLTNSSASNLVSCSATSLTGKSMIDVSLLKVSDTSSWSGWCSDDDSDNSAQACSCSLLSRFSAVWAKRRKQTRRFNWAKRSFKDWY